MKRVVSVFNALVLFSALPFFASAHSYGPPPGSAGPPSDRYCGAVGCHYPSTPGNGSVSAAFSQGASYIPGVTQHVVITISDPAQRRWGFQATARPTAAPRSAQAGSFTPADSNTQVVCSDGNQKPAGGVCGGSPPFEYIEQTLEGTRLGTPGPVTFEFDWTPSADTQGDVTFYVAANAANGDGTQFGDHLYYKNYTLSRSLGLPTISSAGAVNAASFQPGVVPGSWITIMGTGLAKSTRTWQASDFVNGATPTSLDGVSVTIDAKPAFIGYISPTQINAIAPDDSSTGTVSVQVTNNGQSSPAAATQVNVQQPAFFLWNGTYVAARHGADYSLVGSATLFPNQSTPAKPGEIVLLYGTGFGPTNPPTPSGTVVNLPTPLANAATVRIGGVAANVSYSGLLPGALGVYQLNVSIPEGLADGDQTVQAMVNGVPTPPASITIQH